VSLIEKNEYKVLITGATGAVAVGCLCKKKLVVSYCTFSDVGPGSFLLGIHTAEQALCAKIVPICYSYWR
jgi:hypothetical protein